MAQTHRTPRQEHPSQGRRATGSALADEPRSEAPPNHWLLVSTPSSGKVKCISVWLVSLNLICMSRVNHFQQSLISKVPSKGPYFESIARRELSGRNPCKALHAHYIEPRQKRVPTSDPWQEREGLRQGCKYCPPNLWECRQDVR